METFEVHQWKVLGPDSVVVSTWDGKTFACATPLDALDAIQLHKHAVEECWGSVTAIGKKCTEFENDREYNAELVKERDAKIAALLAERDGLLKAVEELRALHRESEVLGEERRKAIAEIREMLESILAEQGKKS